MVNALDDVKRALADFKLLDFETFNPVDKCTEIAYREQSSGRLKRVTKSMTGIVYPQQDRGASIRAQPRGVRYSWSPCFDCRLRGCQRRRLSLFPILDPALCRRHVNYERCSRSQGRSSDARAITIDVVCFAIPAFCYKFQFPRSMFLIIAFLNYGNIMTLSVNCILPSMEDLIQILTVFT